MKLWLILLIAVFMPARAAMDITRELEAPATVAPGQPITVAVTFWTDTWFTPPPTWPDFDIQNGALVNTPLPNQLLTRQKNGISWSGIKLERQAIAWDQGTLRLPAVDITLEPSNSAPVTVHLPELKQLITWPPDVDQPDRFLPAKNLKISQQFIDYASGKDNVLRAGDAIDRVVTVTGEGILPVQIPQILFAIPGDGSQRLSPENNYIKSGRGDIVGARRQETLRYFPAQAGTITIPPVKLRWWDTEHQIWQVAALPGRNVNLAAPLNPGTESVLRGSNDTSLWIKTLLFVAILLTGTALWFTRKSLHRAITGLRRRWQRFWNPIHLPCLGTTKRPL